MFRSFDEGTERIEGSVTAEREGLRKDREYETFPDGMTHPLITPIRRQVSTARRKLRAVGASSSR